MPTQHVLETNYLRTSPPGTICTFFHVESVLIVLDYFDKKGNNRQNTAAKDSLSCGSFGSVVKRSCQLTLFRKTLHKIPCLLLT